MRYLPPFETIKGMLNLTTARGKTRVDMTYDEIQEMIRLLLRAIPVDEAFYLERNADVVDAISQGTIESAQEHFVEHGYFEGRLPYKIRVDDAWYLHANPDVAESIRSGGYVTGQEHFDGPGYSEGRAPFSQNWASARIET